MSLLNISFIFFIEACHSWRNTPTCACVCESLSLLLRLMWGVCDSVISFFGSQLDLCSTPHTIEVTRAFNRTRNTQALAGETSKRLFSRIFFKFDPRLFSILYATQGDRFPLCFMLTVVALYVNTKQNRSSTSAENVEVHSEE